MAKSVAIVCRGDSVFGSHHGNNRSPVYKVRGMKKPKASANDYKVLAKLSYKKHADQIKKDLPSGYQYDESLSNRETKVFYNPVTKKAVVSYRGTNPKDLGTLFKDIRSDWNIVKGNEDNDPRFKQAVREFKKINSKYKNMGYSIDTTGHSLGGQLATHVNKKYKGQVNENLSFSRGSGLFEPFRTRSENTYDYSHKRDLVSLGARWSKDKDGKRDHSLVSGTKTKNFVNAHDIDRIDTFEPQLHAV